MKFVSDISSNDLPYLTNCYGSSLYFPLLPVGLTFRLKELCLEANVSQHGLVVRYFRLICLNGSIYISNNSL